MVNATEKDTSNIDHKDYTKRIKCPVILSAFRIEHPTSGSICHFGFSVINLFDEFRRPSIPFFPKSVDYINLQDILQMFEENIDNLDQARLSEYGKFLRNEVVPNEIIEYLNRLEDEYAVQLLLVTNDNSIPWEIICDDSGFWSTKYAIGRIYGVERRDRLYRKDFIGNNHVCDNIPLLLIYDPEGNLDEARKEGETLQKELSESFSIDVLTQNTKAAAMGYAISSNKHDIIHFAGHAEFDNENCLKGYNNTVMRSKTIEDYKLSRCPLVFANACSTAATKYYGARSNSIAEAFIKAGASAFIGTLWRVSDSVSAKFASLFYSYILSGKTIGDSMLQTKKDLSKEQAPENRDWMAFTLFGNPDSRLLKVTEKKGVNRHIVQILLSNKPGTLGKVLVAMSELGINIVQGRSITLDDDTTAGYISELEVPKEIQVEDLRGRLLGLVEEKIINQVKVM